MFAITLNYDNEITVTLKKNGVTFNIPVTATVRAAVIDKTHKGLLSAIITASDTAPGADWSNSKIVFNFSAADISDLAQGDYKLEIQVDDNGKTPWFLNGSVVNGLIT